jgi:hypothetical protein
VQEGTTTDEKNWNRRPEGAGDYRTVVEVSGRYQVAQFRVPAAPANLQALCAARTEAVATALLTLEAQVKTLAGRGTATPEARRELAFARHDLGQIHAYEGRLGPAIAELEAAYGLVSDPQASQPAFAEARHYLESVLGVLHLRQGELENCVHDRNADRCIFPIRGRGEHAETRGSEAALAYFERRLAREPDDHEARWLLNVAYMTLGRHPDGVPRERLIPAESFASSDDPGRFEDVAPKLGLDVRGRAGGALVDDVDGDGRLDVVLSSVDPCAPLRYLHQGPDGRFEDWTERARLETQLGGINLVQTDFDNDGRLDLFVMRGGWESPMRNSLLRQDADGTFADVTAAAGLLSASHRTHSAAWADFDGDGHLDVFVAHEESKAALFRNRGDGTFVDVAAAAGVDRATFAKGAAWGDYDDDGRPDLYVSNFGEPNLLYHNEGGGRFREVARAAGVSGPILSFPTWFFDYDNDGWLDLFVASFMPTVDEVARGYLGLPRRAETMRLYRNTGGGRFDDVTEAAGLARVVPSMGANFGDLDNDGFLDFYLGTGAPSYAALVPNVLFRNQGGRRFADVTTATGTGHLQKGHGVAFADLDADGDQDLFCNIGAFVAGDVFPKAAFANPGHGNAWIGLRLAGARANRAAIGARLTLTAAMADGSERRLVREIGSGGSYGASPLAAHVGLGKARRVTSVEVRWPGSGTRQVFRDLSVNRAYVVAEGEAAPRPVSARPAR